MSKYSSDSDSYDGGRRKKHNKGRSASSSSSGSHYSRKSKKSKKKSRRSRSNEKYKSKSYSRRLSPDRVYSLRSSRERSGSRDRHRRSRSRKRSSSYNRRRSRSYSQSRRSCSSSYSRRRSRSPSYSRSRKRSRSISNKRSRSRSRSWSSKDKAVRNRSRSADSSDGRSHSRGSYVKKESSLKSRKSRSPSKEKFRSKDKQKNSPTSGEFEHERLHHTLKKAIKAAETAGKKLQQQGLLGFDLSTITEQQINRENAIEEINAPSFLPKAFSSSAKTKNSENAPVIVDVALPSGKLALSAWNHKPENLLHPNISLENKEDRLNRWVKKLFQIRQRFLCGESWEHS